MFKKTFYTISAIFFLILGILGAILPGMPSIVFLLLSVWFIASVDKRIVIWIYSHSIWDHVIRFKKRLPKTSTATSVSVKIAYLGFAWGTFIFSVIYTDILWINVMMFISAIFSTFMTVIAPKQMVSLNSLEKYRRGNF